MFFVIALAAFIVVVELVAVFGWGTDSRDGRDWTPRQADRTPHGVVHMPRSWWARRGTAGILRG